MTKIAALAALLGCALAGQTAPAAGGWISLFDGTSLQGWKETPFPGHGTVAVKDGVIVLGKGRMTGIHWAGEFPKAGYEIRFEAETPNSKKGETSVRVSFRPPLPQLLPGRLPAPNSDLYEPDAEVIKAARKDARKTGAKIEVFNDPFDAVEGAQAVYTDVWASMGFEAETERRREIFSPFRVTRKLMKHAEKDAFFMHCLPAHRGDEVDADVIDSKISIVYDQAENRLHTQKAIMFSLVEANR